MSYHSALHTLISTSDIEPGTRVSNDLLSRVQSDWHKFREQAQALGFDAVEHRATTFNANDGDEWDQAAHDFILTRNHHGAGFWDGDWHQPWGDRLTELAHSFGELETYLDDDDVLRVY